MPHTMISPVIPAGALGMTSTLTANCLSALLIEQLFTEITETVPLGVSHTTVIVVDVEEPVQPVGKFQI